MVIRRSRRPRLARLIESGRKNKGLWQSDLAARLEVSERTVTKWETGEVMPNPAHLENLAALLELDLATMQQLRFSAKTRKAAG